MRQVSRASFLVSGTAALAATALPWSRALAAPALDITAGGIALSIGQSLASGAIGSIGSFAFGSIMSAMGVDLNGQGAMNAKLDAILAKLDELQNSVTALTRFIEAEDAQIEYDTAYASVQPLIDANKTLSGHYSDLLKLDPKAHAGQVISKIGDIERLINDPTYLRGVETWHNALSGLNGQTSLLRAWGKAVFHEPSASIFDQTQAGKIQSRWDAFDAQQALTVAYLVDHYNSKLIPEPATAQRILAQWWGNRQVQLQALRGCVKKVDVFPQAHDGNIVNVTTNLVFMPDTMVYSRQSNCMWCTVPYGPLDFSNTEPGILNFIVARAENDAASRTNTAGWFLPSQDELYHFAQECGGHFGFGTDLFTAEMNSHGFKIPDGAQLASNCRAAFRYLPRTNDPATRGPQVKLSVFCDVLNQYGTSGREFPTHAYLLLKRPLNSGESYWYS